MQGMSCTARGLHMCTPFVPNGYSLCQLGRAYKLQMHSMPVTTATLLELMIKCKSDACALEEHLAARECNAFCSSGPQPKEVSHLCSESLHLLAVCHRQAHQTELHIHRTRGLSAKHTPASSWVINKQLASNACTIPSAPCAAHALALQQRVPCLEAPRGFCTSIAQRDVMTLHSTSTVQGTTQLYTVPNCTLVTQLYTVPNCTLVTHAARCHRLCYLQNRNCKARETACHPQSSHVMISTTYSGSPQNINQATRTTPRSATSPFGACTPHGASFCTLRPLYPVQCHMYTKPYTNRLRHIYLRCIPGGRISRYCCQRCIP
jgi:hypothetical protein